MIYNPQCKCAHNLKTISLTKILIVQIKIKTDSEKKNFQNSQKPNKTLIQKKPLQTQFTIHNTNITLILKIFLPHIESFYKRKKKMKKF